MKPQYLKDYHPNLLSWNEFENIINIRPLMTQEKVHILSPEAHLVWENDVWTTNPGCYPPTVLREAIQNMFVGLVRCLEQQRQSIIWHIRLKKNLNPQLTHIFTVVLI